MALTRKRVGSTRNPQSPNASSTSSAFDGGYTGRSGSVRSNATDPIHQNHIDSNFSDILQRIAGNSDNSILQTLLSLGIDQEKGLSGSQRDDWNKQLLDTLLNYALTQENRSYNEFMRDEQRLYDSPLNQLARLMGSGISRDAAIQMLSGGSQPIQSDAAVAAEGIAPSESKMNGINAALAPIQTAFDAISAVGSLVGLGFSIPQAIEQTKLLKTQNALSRNQLNGFNSASAAFTVLNSIGATADSFGSASNAIAAIQKAADSGNLDAQSFINSGGLQQLQESSYFSSQALSDMYRSERASSDYDRSFGLYVDQTEAETDLKRANKDAVVQSILNMQEELGEITAQTDFINEQKRMIQYSINVLTEQANLLKKQGKTEDARRRDIEASALRTELENEFTQGFYNEVVTAADGSKITGLRAMTYGAAVNAYNDMKKFILSKNKKIWEHETNFLASNYERLYNMNLLYTAFNSGALNKFNTDPNFRDFMTVMSAFSTCGAWDFINAKINAGTGEAFNTTIKHFNDRDIDKLIDKFK